MLFQFICDHFTYSHLMSRQRLQYQRGVLTSATQRLYCWGHNGCNPWCHWARQNFCPHHLPSGFPVAEGQRHVQEAVQQQRVVRVDAQPPLEGMPRDRQVSQLRRLQSVPSLSLLVPVATLLGPQPADSDTTDIKLST